MIKSTFLIVSKALAVHERVSNTYESGFDETKDTAGTFLTSTPRRILRMTARFSNALDAISLSCSISVNLDGCSPPP